MHSHFHVKPNLVLRLGWGFDKKHVLQSNKSNEILPDNNKTGPVADMKHLFTPQSCSLRNHKHLLDNIKAGALAAGKNSLTN